jgi:DNA-binding transcriptional ArsR family regulator
MPTSDSPPARRSKKAKSHPRLTEIDRFVDHFLSTMCDRSRRQILELLAKPDEDAQTSMVELRAGDIAKALKLSPATISGHLRQLTEAGLIASRRDGNAIYYRLRNHLLMRAFQDLLLALQNEHASRISDKTS